MKQIYRSRLNSLPVNLKEEIAEYVLQWGMTATNRRLGILETFKKYNVRADELGTGTNRLIVRIGGYAIKIALDDEGIDDNRQEWVMSTMLAPYVPQSLEISGDIISKPDGSCEILGGHLLVAEYAPAFANWSAMIMYSPQIRKILNTLSKKFLLGDVGVTRKNYANWGLLRGKPVIIDYAYVFPASMNLYKCISCNSDNLEIDKSEFSAYRCPLCQRTYSDSELRARIPNSKRHELFSKVEGIRMFEEFEEHDVNPKYCKQKDPGIIAPCEIPPMELARIANRCNGYRFTEDLLRED